MLNIHSVIGSNLFFPIGQITYNCYYSLQINENKTVINGFHDLMRPLGLIISFF